MEYIIYNIKIVITMFINIYCTKVNKFFHDIFSNPSGLSVSYIDPLHYNHKKTMIDISLLNKFFGNSFFNEFNELYYY